MIPKVTIYDLYKDVFKRSTLIAIPNMSELLQVPDSEFSKWEIFSQIVKEALKVFEYAYPLGRIQKLYIEVEYNSRKAKYFDNFTAYLDNLIDEDDIVLPIASCQGLAYNGYVNSQYPLRNFRFENGEFTDFWYPTQVYYANCLCKRPLIEDYVRKEGTEHQMPTDKCAVYFLRMDLDNQYTIFRDQVFIELCRYITTIKKNFGLANMPIELFQGLEEDYNNTKSKNEQIYQQALRSSPWIL